MARRNRYYSGPVSGNFDGTRFFIEGHSGARTREVIKWNLTSSPKRWPRRLNNGKYPLPPQRVTGSDILCTWVGQATALIQVQGLNIITDPFFSKRASPLRWVGPQRVRPPGIALADLPPIDIVLVSHNHYDHMDLPALRHIAKRWAPRIVTPLGNAAIIRRCRAKSDITELDWWQTVTVSGFNITATPTFHWSKRGLRDRNHALWSAFGIETGAGFIYFGADTGYGDGSTFRDIRQRFGTPRLSLLPIGAYEPRWFMKQEHMNPDDAVRAHLDLESATSIAIHHSTVRLTDEAIDAPTQAHREALQRHDVPTDRFRLIEAGETLSVP